MSARRWPATLAFLLLIPAAAQAASRSNTPEIFYQPAAGGMAASFGTYFFTPSAATNQVSAGAWVSSRDITMSGYRAQFEYSFTEAWAVHVEAMSESQAIKVSDQFGSVNEKAQGFRDYQVWLSNLSALGSWTLYVALGANLSMEKHFEPALNHDGDLFSGGTSIVNRLGLSTPVGAGDYLGVKLGYITHMDRTANANTGSSADYQVVGGNEFSGRLFFESEISFFSADVEAGYDIVDPETMHYVGGGQATNDAYRALVYGAGLQFQFLNAFNLRLAYETQSFTDRNQAGLLVPASSQSTASARLRFEF